MLELKNVVELLESYGLPMVLAIGMYFKWNKDTKGFKKSLDEKEKENKKYTNERIGELKGELSLTRAEAREDKLLFKESLKSFEKALDRFTAIDDNIKDIKTEIKIIQNDIDDIKMK